jgi:hypothetical protein
MVGCLWSFGGGKEEYLIMSKIKNNIITTTIPACDDAEKGGNWWGKS